MMAKVAGNGIPIGASQSWGGSQQMRGALWGALFAFVVSFLVYHQYSCPYIQWNGGNPVTSHPGSCWCGADSYCLCTPSLAIDAIIEVTSLESAPQDDVVVVLVQRRDSTDVIHAIPGGFVNIGETVEAATRREVKEETNLNLNHMEQFRVYSDPTRDARRHTVSAVFRCRVAMGDISTIKQGDDAKAVVLVSLKRSLKTLQLAFDHRLILEDYLRHFHPNLAPHILSSSSSREP
jgi:8-oxo-dGTP diphosphatase